MCGARSDGLWRQADPCRGARGVDHCRRDGVLCRPWLRSLTAWRSAQTEWPSLSFGFPTELGVEPSRTGVARGRRRFVSGPILVEVAGNEPASFGSTMGLLRAQPAKSFGIGSLASIRTNSYPKFDFPSKAFGGPRQGESHSMTPKPGPWNRDRLGVASF